MTELVYYLHQDNTFNVREYVGTNMRLRLKTRWNNRKKEHSISERAGALAFNIWRIAGANVLHLENEGYQTDTQSQRLDVIAEVSAFLCHVTDRILVEKDFEEEERSAYITNLALSLAKTMRDNRIDFKKDQEGRDYSSEYIDLLNQRMSEYSQFSFENGEPGFHFKRHLGECVTRVMGDKDRKWVTQQVIDIEVPDALKTFRKPLKDLVG